MDRNFILAGPTNPLVVTVSPVIVANAVADMERSGDPVESAIRVGRSWGLSREGCAELVAAVVVSQN